MWFSIRIFKKITEKITYLLKKEKEMPIITKKNFSNKNIKTVDITIPASNHILPYTISVYLSPSDLK